MPRHLCRGRRQINSPALFTGLSKLSSRIYAERRGGNDDRLGRGSIATISMLLRPREIRPSSCDRTKPRKRSLAIEQDLSDAGTGSTQPPARSLLEDSSG